MNAIAAVRMNENPSGCSSLPQRVRAERSRRRRATVAAAAALSAGALLAAGCATVGTSDDGASARRAHIERELAEAAPALAEYARLERTGRAAKAGAEQARALAQPSVRWLALLDALSGDAHSGVTVSRLQGSSTGIELQVSAADSAACVAWMDRLRRLRGAESVEMVDLKSAAAADAKRSDDAIEAVVRVRWQGEREPRPARRTAYHERARAERASDRTSDRSGR
jgi:Tfp pilus assembly protein PilN